MAGKGGGKKDAKARETPLQFGGVKVLSQELVMAPIAALKHHPLNPNVGDRAAIKESIDDVGFYGAVVVQKSTGYILKGNHTYDSGAGSGMSHIPTIYVDVDDDTALKILVGDNRIAQLSRYDEEKLVAAVNRLKAIAGDKAAGGYSPKQMSSLLERLQKPESRQAEPSGDPTHIEKRWAVLVECRDEAHQVSMLERFAEEGLSCRALIS